VNTKPQFAPVSINQSINQSIKQASKQAIKMYIAPLQDPYSEALPTQAKRKRSLEKVVELRAGTVWEVP